MAGLTTHSSQQNLRQVFRRLSNARDHDQPVQPEVELVRRERHAAQFARFGCETLTLTRFVIAVYPREPVVVGRRGRLRPAVSPGDISIPVTRPTPSNIRDRRLSVEQFVPQPRIKTLDKAVLPRTAGLDVGRLCPDAGDPLLHFRGGGSGGNFGWI